MQLNGEMRQTVEQLAGRVFLILVRSGIAIAVAQGLPCTLHAEGDFRSGQRYSAALRIQRPQRSRHGIAAVAAQFGAIRHQFDAHGRAGRLDGRLHSRGKATFTLRRKQPVDGIRGGSDAETLERARALLTHTDNQSTQRVYRRKPELAKSAKIGFE